MPLRTVDRQLRTGADVLILRLFARIEMQVCTYTLAACQLRTWWALVIGPGDRYVQLLPQVAVLR